GTTSQPLGFPAPLARRLVFPCACKADFTSALTSKRRANGTGRAHRLSVRSTPEIHYGSNGFRTLTCFEVPLHPNCIPSAPRRQTSSRLPSPRRLGSDKMAVATNQNMQISFVSPQTNRGKELEVEAHLSRIRARRHEVRAAERRQEVIKRNFVRQVDHSEAQAPLVAIGVEQVVVPDAQIKQVTRRDAGRI